MQLSDQQQLDIPSKPGVYFFKQGTETLYIGKATNLKNRTASYFQTKLMETRGPLIVKMVEDATSITWQETPSVLEALLLESYLIKKHQPVYNTKEKDNKSYNYVVITDEMFPRVFTVRQRQLNLLQGRKEKLLHVFGPFPQGQLLREALKIIRKIFPFFTKKTKNLHTAEFYKQLGLLPQSNDTESRQAYLKNIGYIALFFKGQRQSILKKMKQDMMQYAKNLEFEKADLIKKQMYALEHIRDMALLKHDFELSTYQASFRMEAYDIAHLQGDAMVGVMVVHNGFEIDSGEHRVFNIKGFDRSNDVGALREVLERRLNHTEWQFPDIIIVDGGIAQKRVMEKMLREHDIKIPVCAVVKDDKHKAKAILGQKKIIEKHHKKILALNTESHRFAIKKHRERKQRDFL